MSKEILPYSEIEFLGLGTYGVIVSEPGSDTCRKIFTKNRAMSLIREAFIIKKLSHIQGITEIIKLDHPTSVDHDVITRVKGSNKNPAWGVIVMPRYDLTLNQWLRTTPSYESRLQILKEILRIVTQTHSAGIIHADLKLENVMLTYDGKVRIIDWGLSSFKGYARIHGTTKAYRPTRLSQNYCHDIYSLGVLMIQLLLGILIVNPLEYSACLRMLDTAIIDSHLRKLLARMLHPECKNRPLIQDVISFFAITVEIPVITETYSHLDLESVYGLSKMLYPSIFSRWLRDHPKRQISIICIIGAIYSCLNSDRLIHLSDYSDVIFLLDSI